MAIQALHTRGHRPRQGGSRVEGHRRGALRRGGGWGCGEHPLCERGLHGRRGDAGQGRRDGGVLVADLAELLLQHLDLALLGRLSSILLLLLEDHELLQHLLLLLLLLLVRR